MITVERREVKRRGAVYSCWVEGRGFTWRECYTVASRKWCVMEDGKVLAECRNKAIAKRIRAALAGEVEG